MYPHTYNNVSNSQKFPGESWAGIYVPNAVRAVVEGNRRDRQPFINIRVRGQSAGLCYPAVCCGWLMPWDPYIIRVRGGREQMLTCITLL